MPTATVCVGERTYTVLDRLPQRKRSTGPRPSAKMRERFGVMVENRGKWVIWPVAADPKSLRKSLLTAARALGYKGTIEVATRKGVTYAKYRSPKPVI